MFIRNVANYCWAACISETLVSELLLHASILIQSTALIFYEHIITINREIYLIWKYQISAPIILFLLNRYIVLSAAIIYLLEFVVPMTVQVRVALVAGLTVDSLSSRGFSALRVCAITRMQWFPTLLVLLTGLIPVATNVVRIDVRVFTNYF
ncbi:hypothetical protein WOLCODRAFT_81396 [Wolfiporia cocos MD-104 SS10]|uniref:DUF6533 domain-containing protein n=1 Tax=Wolfiporia cocos (strain MD-104) TaxID=742152 RepID=A0A2H3JJE7_WOLCO|nr:hypothetical protein WOLCODRAFT_81396 [Wolfiporia cocos MD-104 SS10]